AKARDVVTRLAGILAAGFRLTVPPSDQVPPRQLALSFPRENAFFKVKIRYADAAAPVELPALGRIGSYTTAEFWKASPLSAEQKDLFALLQQALQDPADPVRLQAAYFLSLLRDPRSEPLVAEVFKSVQVNRLANAPVRAVGK